MGKIIWGQNKARLKVNTDEKDNFKKSQESVNFKQEKYLIFLKCCHFSTPAQMSVPDLVNSSFTTESFAVKVWRRFFFYRNEEPLFGVSVHSDRNGKVLNRVPFCRA